MVIHTFKNQDYRKLMASHNFNNLFEDPEFPAVDRSIYYTQRVPSSIQWKRPYEICKNPQFIVEEANRFDLDQGELGNCWFIAAVSMITQNPAIFEKVVPLDQTFDPEYYAGIFHFRFWQFGKWYDVVVDDRLPTWPNGKLVFCRNAKENNEFWAALLEKAYAKLSWSYEGLEAGQTTDALIDMTGGIEETFNLRDMKTTAEKNSFWETIKNALMHDAMMGCSINPDPRIKEAKLANGLVRGHAYAVTGAVTVNVGGQFVRLIRCRNPWGNEVEWNGAWCDSDSRWNAIDSITRSQMGVTSQADGEFWMDYIDWINEFQHVQICNLSPESLNEDVDHREVSSTWNLVSFDGAWIKGKNAGGCGQPNPENFWINPQFLIEIKQSSIDSRDNRCTLIAACLQKYTRQKRMQTGGRPAEEYIQIRIFKKVYTTVFDKVGTYATLDKKKNSGTHTSVQVYKIFAERCAEKMSCLSFLSQYQVSTSIDSVTSDVKFYPKDLERVATSGAYINKREVTCRLRVSAGRYVIIPSTYEANKEGKFLIRIFTEARPIGRPLVVNTPNPVPSDFEYLDGKGVDPKYQLKQWWDSLPPEERARVAKMAAAGIGVCCCLIYMSEFFKTKGRRRLVTGDEDYS